jgi:C4-dicarboxylate transporter DctM subunit
MVALMFVLLAGLTILGMPIAFATGISSLVYLIYMGIPLSVVSQNVVSGIDSFTIFAIPFFYLAGELMNFSGVTERIISLAKVLVGHIRGGLAQVNIVASVFFAGISGSATADTAALGSILIPAMKKDGYDAEFSAAITVASSMIGPIIPPSIGLVLYGVLAQQSVGKLLVAGILPGFVIAISQMVFTHYYSIKRNYPVTEKVTRKESKDALIRGIPAIAMPIIIVLGILSGVFTPTEAAAVAVLYGFIMGAVVYKEIDTRGAWNLILGVSLRSIKVLLIIAFASMFSWVVTRAQIPAKVLTFLLDLSTNKHIILGLITLFIFMMGLFMIPSAIQVVLTPILVPVIMKLGIDPIHFGVLLVFTTGIGSITPPVGICLSLASEIAEIPYDRLVKAMIPLYIPMFVAVLLIAYIPWFSTFIPNLFLK